MSVPEHGDPVGRSDGLQMILDFESGPAPARGAPARADSNPPGPDAREEALLGAALGILERRFRRAGAALDSPRQSAEYFRMKLAHLSREVFAVAYLDHHYRVLATEIPFAGTLSQCVVHPREVIRQGLGYNAAAILCAHNHPSGLAEASQADRQLTQKLKEALALVDIRLLDHFVIGGTQWVSFADQGWL